MRAHGNVAQPVHAADHRALVASPRAGRAASAGAEARRDFARSGFSTSRSRGCTMKIKIVDTILFFLVGLLVMLMAFMFFAEPKPDYAPPIVNGIPARPGGWF
jgi:hypothetical protein